MGYTTEFEGQIDIEPPLSEKEIKYINMFSGTRRMDRENGPYYVGGTGMAGQGDDADINDHNNPPAEQPGLWCHWVASEDGTFIEWDGGEKFYDASEWMTYIINHFLCLDPVAKHANTHFDFLEGHTLNGYIKAYGEESDDRWSITVTDNEVTVKEAETVW